MAGESAHVHLVHDGARGRPLERRIAFPVVSTRIDDHALHRRRGVVAFMAGGVATVVFRHNHATAVRVEEDFGGIKAHAVGRIERSLNAIAVELPGLHARHEHVPVVVRPVADRIEADHARRPGVIFPVKKQQLHACGAAGEDAEIDATVNDGGAKRTAVASVSNRVHDCFFSHTATLGYRLTSLTSLASLAATMDGDPHLLLTGRTASGCSRVS